jgi:DNA-binding response OmpR family regulator
MSSPLSRDDRKTVLLVDDEQAITEQLAPFLERSGFRVITAPDGVEGLALYAVEHPDVIVLDVMMPQLGGREVLRRLRKDGHWTPVLLLTQVGESLERAMALEEGADDYLNKPFDPHELVARIRAILRRSDPGRPSLGMSQQLRSYSLKLDRVSRRVWNGDAELNLTPKAVLLLDYMMIHPDELLTRERLLSALWGWDEPVGTRAIDNRIAEIRRALEDDSAKPKWIETIAGQGYRFTAEVRGI